MQYELLERDIKGLYKLCDEIEPRIAGKLLKQYAIFVDSLEKDGDVAISIGNPDNKSCFIFIHDLARSPGYIASIEIVNMGPIKQLLCYLNNKRFKKLSSYSEADIELKEKAFKYRRFIPDDVYIHWKRMVTAAFTSIAGPKGHYSIQDRDKDAFLVEVLNERINLKMTAMLIKR